MDRGQNTRTGQSLGVREGSLEDARSRRSEAKVCGLGFRKPRDLRPRPGYSRCLLAHQCGPTAG